MDGDLGGGKLGGDSNVITGVLVILLFGGLPGPGLGLETRSGDDDRFWRECKENPTI